MTDQKIANVRRFNTLTPFRVHEVLLVSSPYDAFILQEDGHLAERMFAVFKGVSSSAPRFTHATNGESAIQLLEKRRFDLILAMPSLVDMDLNHFGRRVKEVRPGTSVVLLALDRGEIDTIEDTLDPAAIDNFFLWSGDIQILLAVIKSVEDLENTDHDVHRGNLRVIVFVEDSPQYYSRIMGVIYRDLMLQSLSLHAEGMNDLYSLMYMKSRPKLLHARTFEDAERILDRYQHNLLAVISDIGIPRHGELDPSAGLSLAKEVRERHPDLPLLLLTAASQLKKEAAVLGAHFMDKNSSNLQSELSQFLSAHLGFGDFIFRNPDGREVDRASDLRELERKLAEVSDEQLMYHAKRNHFSMWLMARSEFEFAEALRPQTPDEFKTVGEFRAYLIRTLRENREAIHRGVIADFRPDRIESGLVCRIGKGYLGGKARGIAFLHQTLAEVSPDEFPGLPLVIPQSVVLTTDEFDRFLDGNDLRFFALECESDEQIQERFLGGQFSSELMTRLESIVERVRGPLAVRSSSLLEDSAHQPFAGIYDTLMIPNEDPKSSNRLRDLCGAIKLVFASGFSSSAKTYMAATGNRIEEEKMGVIIQRVVGQPHGSRFYPSFSGVAQSFNFYPIGPQEADDGIAHVALGLGHQVVNGGLAIRFSPRHPHAIPEFSMPEKLMDCTQRGFWALEMTRNWQSVGRHLFSTLAYHGLEVAEEDGTLLPVGSVYSPDDRQIRDDLTLEGLRVITFNNILKHKIIPLSKTISKVLQIIKRGMGCQVEVEFACDMGDWGKPVQGASARLAPRFYVLQVRPLNTYGLLNGVEVDKFRGEDLLCSSRSSLGHMLSHEIRDIVYVDRRKWDSSQNRKIAQEVGELNSEMRKEGCSYILVGPGRWGTADEWLGIPVKWAQISAVKVLVEASPEGYNVDPSQGTHFFHNMTAQGIGYLTLPAGAEKRGNDQDLFLDWEWLDRQPAFRETEHLRHLRLGKPMTVALDGKQGRAIITKSSGAVLPGLS